MDVSNKNLDIIKGKNYSDMLKWYGKCIQDDCNRGERSSSTLNTKRSGIFFKQVAGRGDHHE